MIRYYQCPFLNQKGYASEDFNANGYIAPLPDYYYRLDYDMSSESAKEIDNTETSNAAEKQEYLPMKPLSFDEEEEIQQTVGRVPHDVNKVIEIIDQKVLQEINEVIRTGMNKKLLDYLIRAKVYYIDKNYDRYQGTISRKVEMALFDMKRDLTWVFDIMRIYNVSLATEGRLLDKIARLAMQSLRS